MKQYVSLPVLFLSLLVGISSPSLSDNIFATTDDGKRVRLNNDGSWEYQIKSKINNALDSYSGELVKVSIIETKFGRSDFVVKLEVSSNTPTSILKIRTHRVWGYTNGSSTGGRTPIGFVVKDNFGNDMKVKSVSPSFTGYKKEKGLRYGENKIFTITTTETPLNAASFMVLQISRNVFGNKEPIELKIPTTDIVKN